MKNSFWLLDYFISPFSNNWFLDCSFLNNKDDVFEISKARLGVPGNRGAKGTRELRVFPDNISNLHNFLKLDWRINVSFLVRRWMVNVPSLYIAKGRFPTL